MYDDEGVTPADASPPGPQQPGAAAPAGPQVPAEPQPQGRTQPPARHGAMSNYARNMAISLAVLIVPLVVLVAFCSPSADELATIDPSGTYQAAKSEAKFGIRIPAGLPDGWRATNSSINRGDSGAVTLRVSYLTPAGKFAQLLQSDVASDQLLPEELGGGTIQGMTEVGGVTWQRYGGRRARETALVLLEPESSVLVVGDASIDELRALAASLR
jgi:Protein of unknown function (DUF4245)